MTPAARHTRHSRWVWVGLSLFGAGLIACATANDRQQRICVGEAVRGTTTTCVGPIGNSNCTPAVCASGAVDLGVIKEHNELASVTANIRRCVVPQCPPSCP